MTEALVLVSQTGAVRTLTLNRPASLNSFTSELHVELMNALNAAAVDAGVRCVVLTGAGRAFSGGQDLSDPMASPNPGGAPKDLRILLDTYYTPLVNRLRSMPVPVIAAVNGVAAGAGANVALNCDLVVAASNASFIQAFTKIGLLPDSGGTWLLPRLVGRAHSLGLALLGDKLTAADAERIGLIWRCIEADDFTEEVQALAQRLSLLPTHALVTTRNVIDEAFELSFADALDREAAEQRRLAFAADYTEGVTAFLEKRSPTFTDR
jgi:2-(1,2-epoxy-1,2-dihydrophenyl)acetyl-CoA isomerase